MLKEILKEKIPRKYHEHLPSSFDIIGSKEMAVAVIEIQDKVKKYKKLIAETLMQNHKNVRTVLMKSSPVKGMYRKRDYVFLAGEKKTEVFTRKTVAFFWWIREKLISRPEKAQKGSA